MKFNYFESRSDIKHAVFLDAAFNIAKLSKDTTKVGAVIVSSDGEQISSGYNGYPQGFNDDVLPTGKIQVPMEASISITDNKSGVKKTGTLKCTCNKYPWIIHAEKNAIKFALRSKASSKLRGSYMYCTRFACENCALEIASEGIAELHVPWDLTSDGENLHCIGEGSTSGMTTNPINVSVAILKHANVKLVFKNVTI